MEKRGMMRGRFVASWSREWDGRVIGVVVLCDELGGVIGMEEGGRWGGKEMSIEGWIG